MWQRQRRNLLPMPDKPPASLRIVYFAHSLRSDWNNGNAHFLRGLMRSLVALGHQVLIFEPEHEWSIDNLLTESKGSRSLADFLRTYPDLHIQTYTPDDTDTAWQSRLADTDIVILHEWNPPALASKLLLLRKALGFRLLFHDTHHRASSSPGQIRAFRLNEFDGILAFGEALRNLYRERFGLTRVWTLHEAADTSVFRPLDGVEEKNAVVWIGNWGEGERSAEIREFLLQPAANLRNLITTHIYGVRYPEDGLEALRECGVEYGGYLPNLDAPAVYAASRATVHIPRQQYTSPAMTGIPTIRVFEALACGIPLISAPWRDTEHLFREGDFLFASNVGETAERLRHLLTYPEEAKDQAARGRETILARHTCDHRALELTSICEEVLA